MIIQKETRVYKSLEYKEVCTVKTVLNSCLIERAWWKGCLFLRAHKTHFILCRKRLDRPDVYSLSVWRLFTKSPWKKNVTRLGKPKVTEKEKKSMKRETVSLFFFSSSFILFWFCYHETNWRRRHKLVDMRNRQLLYSVIIVLRTFFARDVTSFLRSIITSFCRFFSEKISVCLTSFLSFLSRVSSIRVVPFLGHKTFKVEKDEDTV